MAIQVDNERHMIEVEYLPEVPIATDATAAAQIQAMQEQERNAQQTEIERLQKLVVILRNQGNPDELKPEGLEVRDAEPS